MEAYTLAAIIYAKTRSYASVNFLKLLSINNNEHIGTVIRHGYQFERCRNSTRCAVS